MEIFIAYLVVIIHNLLMYLLFYHVIKNRINEIQEKVKRIKNSCDSLDVRSSINNELIFSCIDIQTDLINIVDSLKNEKGEQ